MCAVRERVFEANLANSYFHTPEEIETRLEEISQSYTTPNDHSKVYTLPMGKTKVAVSYSIDKTKAFFDVMTSKPRNFLNLFHRRNGLSDVLNNFLINMGISTTHEEVGQAIRTPVYNDRSKDWSII